MYTGYQLSHYTRKRLQEAFPPLYDDFIGHHVTEVFGVPNDHPLPAEPETIRAVAYANDGVVEGFVVEINGSSARPDGGTYHLTWSLNREAGAKPVHTNTILHLATPIEPIDLVVGVQKYFW